MRQRFSSIDPEQQVWVDHPLRAIREIANATFETLSREFARFYSGWGDRLLHRRSCCGRSGVRRDLANRHHY
jgi:hypothetical protein